VQPDQLVDWEIVVVLVLGTKREQVEAQQRPLYLGIYQIRQRTAVPNGRPNFGKRRTWRHSGGSHKERRRYRNA